MLLFGTALMLILILLICFIASSFLIAARSLPRRLSQLSFGNNWLHILDLAMELTLKLFNIGWVSIQSFWLLGRLILSHLLPWLLLLRTFEVIINGNIVKILMVSSPGEQLLYIGIACLMRPLIGWYHASSLGWTKDTLPSWRFLKLWLGLRIFNWLI